MSALDRINAFAGELTAIRRDIVTIMHLASGMTSLRLSQWATMSRAFNAAGVALLSK